jgi:hypothetical protein
LKIRQMIATSHAPIPKNIKTSPGRASSIRNRTNPIINQITAGSLQSILTPQFCSVNDNNSDRKLLRINV